MKTWMKVVLLVIAFLAIEGCEYRMTEDGKKEIRVNPQKAEQVEAAAEGVKDFMTAVGGDIGLIGGGALAGLLTMWRRMKPQVTTYKSEAEQYQAVAASTVNVFDDLKTMSPEMWERCKPKMEAELKKHGIQVDVLEAVIRGLRGLPPKA